MLGCRRYRPHAAPRPPSTPFAPHPQLTPHCWLIPTAAGCDAQAPSGPLARAARILAHSALVVLAGAAGAAAAAGSVTGVLLGPEDLPGDPHGTSIRYGRPEARRRWWHKNAGAASR